MARHLLRLQVLALATASSLLLLAAFPAAHATPPSAVAPHGAPRSTDVDILGPRSLGPRHRFLTDDVPAYADADAPVAASSPSTAADDDPAASSSDNGGGNPEDQRPSSDEGGAAADHSLMAFLQLVLGPVLIVLVVFFVVGAIAILAVLLVKFAGLAADRCASAWRAIKEARKKATRVRPVDEDAAGA